jgi:predicted DNA-binding protein YlxM (UPF0122 family)
MTLLFDFYGDLLTEKQREYYDLHHNEDLSLAEIAEQAGITRQGVHDIITRAESTLMETEAKTGLIGRFTELRGDIDKALVLVGELLELTDDTRIREKALRIADILTHMKG